jgi:hypothetical protein
MAKAYISVVSHGHYSLISSLEILVNLKDYNYHLIVIDNLGEINLYEYCKLNSIDYITDTESRGFGANNNYVYNYVCKTYSPKGSDLFICLNPDVLISNKTLLSFIEDVVVNSYDLATINLYLNSSFTIYDKSIRNFPTILDFLKSFLGSNSDYIIDKSKITEPTSVDWCAGSFISIKFSIYKKLQGFNERYFMYCEDLDFCFRYNRLTSNHVKFLPHYKAQHLAGLQNRKLFTKHFMWHISSIIKFMISKVSNSKVLSSIK